MSHFGLMIESMVAILLLVTIAYCLLLNRRLKRFKADEQSFKATISELITATEIAERAIAGLKETVRECNEDLGSRLGAGARLTNELKREVADGKDILAKIAQITAAARPGQPAAPAPPPASEIAGGPDARAVAAAAQAFAERSRARVSGIAA
jgi:Domain of unknown function (DUF6468)